MELERGPFPPPRQRHPVPLRVSTPEETFRTFREAILNRDWKTVFGAVTAESQLAMLATAFGELNRASFSGSHEGMRARKASRAAIYGKYHYSDPCLFHQNLPASKLR